MPEEKRIREEIVRFGRQLHEDGFVAATDGNLSVRLDERRILTTPTGMSKRHLKSADLVTVDLDGTQLGGRRMPSSELGMHLLIYRLRPDVRAIVHAHPPTATGFAAAGLPLDQPLVCEVVVGLGSIPLAEYGTPGTPELAESLSRYVRDYDAVLMANHGVVTYGEDLHHAYMKMETVEHFAKIALVTRQIGQQNPLRGNDLQKLLDARRKYAGNTSCAAMPLRAPKTGS
jgi:L-fuculose-phosphate aldolase